MLEKKLIRIELYPKTIDTYTVDTSVMAENYDKDIADICMRQALIFISKHEDDEDIERKAQVLILKYLSAYICEDNDRPSIEGTVQVATVATILQTHMNIYRKYSGSGRTILNFSHMKSIHVVTWLLWLPMAESSCKHGIFEVATPKTEWLPVATLKERK